MQVWLADYKSPKINSLGKTTLGLTSMLFLLLQAWARVLVALRERVPHSQGGHVSPHAWAPADGSLPGEARLSASAPC